MTAALDTARDYGHLIGAAAQLHFTAAVKPGCRLHFIPAGADKRPHDTNWPNLATSDPEKLRQLFARNPKSVLLGLATGPKSGVLGIDIDYRHDGDKSLAALQEKYGRLPPPCYRSRGGLRIAFHYPQGVTIPKRSGDIAPGIDVIGGQADGRITAQMILPPSAGYEWIAPAVDFYDLTEPPQWLLWLAIHNKGIRARLAALGIAAHEHEAFRDVDVADWAAKARELLRPHAGAKRDAFHLLDERGIAVVQSYLDAAIDDELAKLEATEKGERDDQANTCAITVHGLMKGASDGGFDTGALEEQTHVRFIEVAEKVMAEDIPHEGWAEQKWARAELAADPRDLSHLGLPTNADDEFERIDGPAGTTAAANLLEHYADVSLEEMIARQSNALVKGVLHPGETCMIYGDSTAGKTFVGIDLGWHIATGRDWHGRRTKQAPVLYVALEGVEGFKKRMLAAGEVHGDPGKWFARFKLHVSLVKSEAGEKGVEKIVEAASLQAQATGQAVGVVMIDTLARATAGDDENAVADMMAFVEKRAGEIARRTGAAVLVVHHENAKGNLRGSSSLRGSFDAVLRVERHSQDTDASRRAIAEKVKDDSEGALFDFKLRSVTLGTDSDGLPVTSCVLATSAPTSKAAPVKDTEGQKALREALDAAFAAGKRAAHPLALDAAAAPEPAIREHFDLIYPKGRTGKNGELSQGAIRKAWHTAINDLPPDIIADVVDGVMCLYVRPVPSTGSTPTVTDPDADFDVIDPPRTKVEKV